MNHPTILEKLNNRKASLLHELEIIDNIINSLQPPQTPAPPSLPVAPAPSNRIATEREKARLWAEKRFNKKIPRR